MKICFYIKLAHTWLADVASLAISWNHGYAYSGWEIVIFDIINSLQGLGIFLVLICKQRMRGIIQASLAPALKCFNHRPFDTVDSAVTRVGSDLSFSNYYSFFNFRKCPQFHQKPRHPLYMAHVHQKAKLPQYPKPQRSS